MPSRSSRVPARTKPVRVSLADGVYDIILSRLIDGEVSAGAPLNIDELARDLAVSQTPIREALARLESTGLVTRAALRGYRVAPLFTDQELADLMDARAVVEPATARFAAGRTTPEFLAELAATITELEAFAESGRDTEVHRYWESDAHFHNLIAEQSENRFLQTAYESLGGHVQRFRLFGALGATDAAFAAREHRDILEALQRGDAQAAQQRMTEHIESVKSRAHHDREAIDTH
ncbi:GntR family transcriptional regulator [Mycetocola tolaasinivorans]|uniref:GntR family transcriptional regulator n=1 Tax=Mycetocola tolaasinivorans TaxID=76635 RepID=A0A3L7AA68_9MICO|nr:GntR family transcriptional regulator [Mycetocola tolaasinivorans]RLP77356.1 GntR family transcriptional regulator [Mycetocola tolaasinivorans]